jgi:hypothetical protein
MAAGVATQLSLLGETARVERPWKRQRQTARTIYRDQRALDVARAAVGAETREGQVLRLLAAHWNATQRTPTALELLHWARGRGEVLFDVNSIACDPNDRSLATCTASAPLRR